MRNQTNKEVIDYFLAPILFLTVALGGGLRFQVETNAILFIRPQLISCMIGLLAMVLLARQGLIRGADYFGEHRGLVGNISGIGARRLPSRFYNSAARDHSDAGLAALKAGGMTFLPPMEVDLAPYLESDGVYSNRLKTDLADQLGYLCPAPLAGAQVRELNWLAAAVFRVIGCNDVSRIDFRLDENDSYKPYVLEINPLPGLAPGISDLVIESDAMGMNHTELVNLILEAAIIRWDLSPRTATSAPNAD